MLYIAKLRFKGRALLCHALLLVFLGALAPLHVSAQALEPIRGLYINGITRVLGHDQAEQQLVDFVKDNHIDYAAIYLRPFEVPELGPQLSDLIVRLKSEGGVTEVGSTTGASDVVITHNEQYPGKFDVMNLENEFWGAPTGTPDREERFQSYINQLDIMTELAEGTDLKVEAYIGWPTQVEMNQIVTRLDRLLVHTYVPTPDRTYPTINTRFQWIADSNSNVEVMPIYSLEKTENNREGGPVFMGQWTIDNSPNRSEYDFTHAFDIAESTFEAGFNAANIDVNMVGHQYFVYSNLVKHPPDNFIDSPTRPNIVVEGGATIPIEFTVRGLHDAQLGVEWYQSGIGHLGSPRFNGEITNSRVITATPPYTVSALAFDTSNFGRPNMYASGPAQWSVHAQNTLPTGNATFPQTQDVFLDVGDTQTFTHTATDAEGNLAAADWFIDGVLNRVNIDGTSATTSRDITFDTAGTFKVHVDVLDQAVYIPGYDIRTNTVRETAVWTVHVDSATNPTDQQMRGRYIMVRKEGPGTLSLTEVQVRGIRADGSVNTASNLAQNQSASQSTTAFGGAASRAVDGNFNGNYNDGSVSHTELNSSNPWWRVDLGATHDVGRINIINRQDCCTERLDGAAVYIGNTASSNPADYTLVGSLTGTAEPQTFSSASGLVAIVSTNATPTVSFATVTATNSEDQLSGTSGGGAIGGGRVEMLLPLLLIIGRFTLRRKRLSVKL